MLGLICLPLTLDCEKTHPLFHSKIVKKGCCIPSPNASFESYKAVTKWAYIQAQDRFQLQMSSLEDCIEIDNPVRFIDAFADQLEFI